MIERWLLKWYIKWHGEGEPHQERIYRCQLCRRLMTWTKIRQGSCVCGTNRIVATYPTLWERFRLFCLPWTV